MATSKNAAAKAASPDSKRKRSPRYPIVAIDEALNRVRLIYDEDRRAFATLNAILEHMGYKVRELRGGRSARMVATLRQYGLLEERDGHYQVSDTAFRILELPEDSLERAQLIRQAALSPPIVKKVVGYYKGQLPSDITLRSHLILSEEFNPDSADEFVRVLRRTMELVNPQPEDYTTGEESDTAEHSAGASPMTQPVLRSPSREQLARSFASGTEAQLHALGVPVPEGRFTEDLNTRISDDCKVRILFDGPVSREAIQKLKRYLDLIADDYPSKAELPRSPEQEE